MGSKSKDQKSKKTKLGVEGPNTRFVINPKTIRLLGEDQVRKIVKETNSELVLDQKQICRLQAVINDCLKLFVPSIENPGWTDIDALRDAVKEIKKKLHVGNQRLLTLMASTAGDHFGSTGDRAATITQFVESIDTISYWLTDEYAYQAVFHSLKPRVNSLQTLTGHFLPDVYEVFFLRRFETGFNSPGIIFVMAVLREAGVRPGDDDCDTIYDQIKRARSRVLSSQNESPLRFNIALLLASESRPRKWKQVDKRNFCRTAVARATVKGDRTIAQLAEQFDVHPNQITAWMAQLEGGASGFLDLAALCRPRLRSM